MRSTLPARAALAALLLVATPLAACGDDDEASSDASSTTTTTDAGTDTTAGTTGSGSTDSSTTSSAGGSSASASSVPSGSGSTTTTVGSPPEPPATPIDYPSGPDDGVSPDGSGCSPPSTSTLPEGTWFGVLTGVDPAAVTVSFDLACLFTGDAANAAATEDGFSEIPVPNDYWIRNANPLGYTLPAVPDVAVVTLAGPGYSEPAATQTGLDGVDWHGTEPGTFWRGWIVVDDGWVTVVQQQFFP
jgi:hypothetical protein